eukprot:3462657-Pleurochrysis_carterae.AAC.1
MPAQQRTPARAPPRPRARPARARPNCQRERAPSRALRASPVGAESRPCARPVTAACAPSPSAQARPHTLAAHAACAPCTRSCR